MFLHTVLEFFNNYIELKKNIFKNMLYGIVLNFFQ